MKLFKKTRNGRFRLAAPEEVFSVAENLAAYKGGEKISSAEDAERVIFHRLRHAKDEQFAVLHLTADHTVIDFQVVATGTIAANTIYPRTLIRNALDTNAAAVVIAHNHPSGATHPSPEDIKLTKKLTGYYQAIDVKLLDHIIVGNTAVSMADLGLLAPGGPVNA